MNIYFSYFGYTNYHKDADKCYISIARYSKFAKLHYPVLYPSAQLLRSSKSGETTVDQYIKQYFKQLTEINPQRVVFELNEISQGKDVVLCCYERPESFCHRHLVRHWLNRNNIPTKELSCDNPWDYVSYIIKQEFKSK